MIKDKDNVVYMLNDVVQNKTVRFMQPYLWPAVIAIGEGPLGGRGSSHVLISTSTLSKNCTKEEANT